VKQKPQHTTTASVDSGRRAAVDTETGQVERRSTDAIVLARIDALERRLRGVESIVITRKGQAGQ
jgi:hypothetical protein